MYMPLFSLFNHYLSDSTAFDITNSKVLNGSGGVGMVRCGSSPSHTSHH